MRFIGISGTLQKARRYVSGHSTVNDEETKNHSKLANILRSIMQRLSDLEARVPAQGIEFEVELLAAGYVYLHHNFNSPVRWWITAWTRPVSGGTYPVIAPIAVQDETSTGNILALQTFSEGRAIIRVEPSAGAIEP